MNAWTLWVHGNPQQRRAALRALITPETSETLRRMPYGDFLRTPYWRIITAHLRRERGGCEHCGRGTDLQVHHLTYQHHGWEHEHPEDLQVLCRTCHAWQHGILTAPWNWRSVRELLPEVFRRIGAPIEVRA